MASGSARWRPLLHTAAAGALLGVGLYTAADVAGELTTFGILRSQALQLAENNEELKQQIGSPFTLGPWYNARIGFSAGRNIAQCSFQLQGKQQITDVTVRGVRRSGISNTLAYNVAGPGEWKLIDCNAMFPSGGGLVEPRSLMPPPPKAAASSSAPGSSTAGSSTAGDSGACSTCPPTQSSQQGPGVPAAQHQEGQSVAADQAQPAEQRQRSWWKVWQRRGS